MVMMRSRALSAELGSLESVAPTGQILRLVLEQAADRVSHRIEILDAAAHVLAELRSVEGTSTDEWPSSPALQSCSLQEIRPGERAAFLVGMAGKSHFSASIEAIPQVGAFYFDFACRVQKTPPWLGTTYAMDGMPRGDGSPFLDWQIGIAVEVVSPDGLSGFQARGQSLLLPCIQQAEKFPATFRWRYGIHLEIAQDR